ncbi:D-alanine--D-alanine ligase [Candidatus Ornithobacterium hominis]|uniref:D-alanine--D-alanine ligase n=1 Tax=Candidatus Ornithobacterium hominis TaxID=2497989 RepID=UPI0024BBEC54|nr:D-alanine--D-alanine ligase [Candidatus Ornithobacterium hominis]CAI9428938.1 D-alanine--D-alanine ligase [Candidatus Ornithobacterium hominis]
MKNIAVVSGGFSDEHKVSLKSGQTILNHIDKNKFHAFDVQILSNIWQVVIDGKKFPIEKSDFSFTKNGQKIKFDCVFNIIHGTPGEDGYLQAYWDLVGQKYTGCGHYLSALTFNKKDCLAVLNKYGISTARSVYLRENNDYDVDEIIENLGLPCFVKPNQSGSSLGISKVKKKEDFSKALEIAFKEDQDILIEEFIDGTEVSVGVIEYKNEIIVPGITEIISYNDFFDYQAKYEGQSKEITPANIPSDLYEKISSTAIHIYKSLGLKGMSRSEFILRDNTPYFIEINTLPGFSPASILPQQLAYAKISIQDFITNEIESALKSLD